MPCKVSCIRVTLESSQSRWLSSANMWIVSQKSYFLQLGFQGLYVGYENILGLLACRCVQWDYFFQHARHCYYFWYCLFLDMVYLAVVPIAIIFIFRPSYFLRVGLLFLACLFLVGTGGSFKVPICSGGGVSKFYIGPRMYGLILEFLHMRTNGSYL